MGSAYPETVRSRELVLRATKGEEERFFATLDKGLEILDNEIKVLEREVKNPLRRDGLQALRHIRLSLRPYRRHHKR